MRIALAPILAGIAILTLTACTSVPSVGEIPASIANATTAADAPGATVTGTPAA